MRGVKTAAIVGRLFAAAIGAWGAADGFQICHAQQPDLPSIQQAVADYHAALRTVQGVYVKSQQRKKAIPAAVSSHVMERHQSHVDFVFDIAGDRLAMDQRNTWYFSAVSPNVPFQDRRLVAFDGQGSYSLTYTLTSGPLSTEVPAERPFRLVVGSDYVFDLNIGVWQLAGLKTRPHGLPLADVLRKPQTHLVGYESLHGADCAHLQVQEDGTTLNAWLDPERNFLPRRLEFQSLDAGRSEQRLFEVTTREFARYDDPVSGEKRWFPTQGQIEHDDVIDAFRVSEMFLNKPVEDSQFQIDAEQLPAGVQINPSNGAVYYTGGGQNAWKELRAQIDAETDELNALLEAGRNTVASNPAAPPVSKQSTSNWSAAPAIALLGLCVLVVFTVAGVAVGRSWRRRK